MWFFITSSRVIPRTHDISRALEFVGELYESYDESEHNAQIGIAISYRIQGLDKPNKKTRRVKTESKKLEKGGSPAAVRLTRQSTSLQP